MDYRGFTIRSRVVFTAKTENDYYTTKGETTAYEVIDPVPGHIMGIYPTIERAKKAIDENGEQWLKSTK